MASIQDTDLLLINRGGADYQAQVSELPPGPSGTPSGGTGDRPGSPEIGDLYFDTDLDLLLVWNGTSWEPVSPPQDPGQWTRTGTKLAPTNPGSTVVVTAADGTENIKLNADGSAEFLKEIQIGGNAADVTRPSGTVIRDFGLFQVSGGAPDGAVFVAYEQAVNSPRIILDNQGGGKFADTVTVGGTMPAGPTAADPNITLNANGSITAAGEVKIGGTLPSAPNITLKADGNAFLGVNGSANGRVNLRPGSVLDASIQVQSGAGGGDIFTLFNNGNIKANSSGNCAIDPKYSFDAADGSATFAGQVTAGADAFGYSNIGSGITPTGSVIARRAGSGNIWLGYQTGTNAQTSQISADGSATFAGDVNAVNGQFTGDVNALTGDVNAVEGTFTDDVNALNAVITDDISLGGDIINTTVDGDQDIICDGEGLVKLTEYNLNPMEVVTKHDIGTGANEVPVNGFLGTLAYKDDLAIQDGTTVALLPTSPTARVGNITRVTDGAASLTWGATVTGGGTAQYLVWYNGTKWTVLGA